MGLFKSTKAQSDHAQPTSSVLPWRQDSVCNFILVASDWQHNPQEVVLDMALVTTRDSEKWSVDLKENGEQNISFWARPTQSQITALATIQQTVCSPCVSMSSSVNWQQSRLPSVAVRRIAMQPALILAQPGSSERWFTAPSCNLYVWCTASTLLNLYRFRRKCRLCLMRRSFTIFLKV